jgi:hypothetical protein
MPEELISQIADVLAAEPALDDVLELETAAGLSVQMEARWLPGRTPGSLLFSRLLASQTGVLFGRSTAGAGAAEEIPCTAYGRSIIAVANQAAAQAGLGLVPGTNVQAYSANLATWAGLLSDLAAARAALGLTIGTNVLAYDSLIAGLSANVRTMLGSADYAAVRTALSLVAGTNVQAYHAMLASLAGLGGAADKGLHLTAANTLALHDLTAAGRAMNAAADAAAQRALLGVTRIRQVQLQLQGGSTPLAVGNVAFSLCSYAGTIKKAYLTSLDAAGAALSGSIVVDVWKHSGIPTVANTITASAKPTLSSASTSLDATLTGWSPAVSAGDRFIAKVDSVSGGLTNVALTLEIET